MFHNLFIYYRLCLLVIVDGLPGLPDMEVLGTGESGLPDCLIWKYLERGRVVCLIA